MIIFICCLICHSFGKRSLSELTWLLAMILGLMEITATIAICAEIIE